MTTVFPSSDGYFQQDNAPCHKVKIISNWFLEHDDEFTLIKCPPQAPDLNPIQHIWDVVQQEIHIMDVQPTYLQQLHDAIMSIWTKISEECLQHLFESGSDGFSVPDHNLESSCACLSRSGQVGKVTNNKINPIMDYATWNTPGQNSHMQGHTTLLPKAGGAILLGNNVNKNHFI